jgi:hypothetical protein
MVQAPFNAEHAAKSKASGVVVGLSFQGDRISSSNGEKGIEFNIVSDFGVATHTLAFLSPDLKTLRGRSNVHVRTSSGEKGGYSYSWTARRLRP